MIASVSTLARSSGATSPSSRMNFSMLTPRSRMSTKCPAIAAAAAIAGLTRCVLPPGPCRPSKLRFEVDAQRSPGESWSSFMPRHIEQPGSRHSKPASVNTLSRPSCSACVFHESRARHDHRELDVRCDVLAFRRPGRGAQIFDARVGARADEDLVELDLGDRRVRLERHVLERALHPFALHRDLSPARDRAPCRRPPRPSAGSCPRSPAA